MNKPKENWEKEFDELYRLNTEPIKDFVRSLLKSERKKVLEKVWKHFDGGIQPEGTMVLPGEYRTWYPNDAIKRVLQTLKEEK